MRQNSPHAVPRIGVGVLVIRDQQILLGERSYSHGANTWCPPGGHLEFGESPIDCAKRELKEESGLEAKKIIEGPWTNDFFKNDNKHYITLFMLITSFSGTPQVMEPQKCKSWRWFPLSNLPSPLFPSFKNFIARHSLINFQKNF